MGKGWFNKSLLEKQAKSDRPSEATNKFIGVDTALYPDGSSVWLTNGVPSVASAMITLGAAMQQVHVPIAKIELRIPLSALTEIVKQSPNITMPLNTENGLPYIMLAGIKIFGEP